MMAFSQVIVGAAIVGEQLTFDLCLQALFVVPTIAGSNALNDFFDLPSDAALGRSDRPLVSGKINPNQALAASILLLVTGVALCLYLTAFLIVVTTCLVLLGIAYNVFLKRMPVIGNIVVGASYAIPLVYGNALADQSLDSLRPVVTFVTILSIALVALNPLPMLFLFSIPYAVLIGASGALRLACAYSAFKDSSYTNLQRLARYHTSALLPGLLPFAILPLTTQPP
jgi:4-hydroxybenzoate polyprenyltransferase